MHNIQEYAMVNDVAMNLPWIYATLESRQANRQLNMIEVEGEIAKKIFAILIDPREFHSYFSPNLVEDFIWREVNILSHGLLSWLLEQKGKSMK